MMKSLKTFSTFYNREKEIKVMHSFLKQEPTFNFVTGCNDTGKTALINHVLSNVVDQNKLFKIELNFRDFQCLNSKDLASEIQMATPNNFNDKIKNLIPNISNIEKVKYDKMSFKFFKKEKRNLSLSKVLKNLKESMPSFSIWNGKLLPVIYMDEVNAIEDLTLDDSGEKAVDYLLRWIIGVTKENPKFHVIFGTSDSFFLHRIEEKVKSERTHITTIGDLSYDEANGYFDFILQNYDDETKELISKNLSFDKDIYPFVGGRMFHIKNAIREFVIYGSKGEKMKLLERKYPMYLEALKVKKGSSKENIFFKKLVEWNRDEIINSFKELCEKGFIASKGVDKERENYLLSMTKHNLLNYRATPPVTEDIKGLTNAHYPVFIASSPLDLYAIKKMISDMI